METLCFAFQFQIDYVHHYPSVRLRKIHQEVLPMPCPYLGQLFTYKPEVEVGGRNEQKDKWQGFFYIGGNSGREKISRELNR